MDDTDKLKTTELAKPADTTVPPVAGDDPNKAALAESTTPTKTKKKKKKKKLTAKEKQLEKLEKLSEKIIDNKEKFNEFVKFVAFWLKTYQNICYKLLNKQAMLTNEIIKMKKVVKNIEDDEDDEGKDIDDDSDDSDENQMDYLISHDNFKLVLEDLNIPCTNVELHLLCKLLDREATGYIDYRKLTPETMKTFIDHGYQDGIRFITASKIPEKKSAPTFTFKLFKPLTTNEFPRYVLVDIKLATFVTEKDFRGHLKDEILYSHMTVYSLIEYIKKKTDISSTHFAIFKDPSRHKSAKLEEAKTLEECGYLGGTYNEPNEYTLFYDYTTTLRNDPILNSDFYFIHSKHTTKK